ncbi:anti-sigma factor family protein [Paraburkholderia kururiensis]|uniref:Anti-sigma factor n=1 Tax=Paraburkholderia kururiensis TaxID=984307 RepID=A0ABZ0WSI0_9BURK|nr:anti-sigma factor [Paraburkholderia kururiensis]WQD80345.1 anti-sigma factor [Paraburkholderia kururiensis]
MNNDDHSHGRGHANHADPPADALDARALQALSAFVDAELPPHARTELEAQLAADPEAASRVAAYRAQRNALRALCAVQSGKANDEAAYVVLRARTPWWQRAGLAACWLVVGAGLAATLATVVPPLFQHHDDYGKPAAFAQRADVAYAVYSPEQRHPVEVGADDQAQLVAWLSKRLERPLSVPSLDDYGYTLVGGRLLPGESGPAAQFMYENAAGTRLTLYVTGAKNQTAALRTLREGERRTIYWITDRTGYALSGQLPEGRLHAIAVDVCTALGGKPDQW